MNAARQSYFEAARAAGGGRLTTRDVAMLDAVLDLAGIARDDIVVAGSIAFDRAAFIARHANTRAPAIMPADIEAAASRLGVTPAQVTMVRKVESAARGFDERGRPVILFEPHVFHRRTAGRFGVTSFSYPRWGQKPYPRGFDARWDQLADAAERDEGAALESASWGLFQIMGWHWAALGYASVQEFCAAMTASEAGHLDALVRYITANELAPALRRCRPGNADSCREFARGYNGEAYERHGYHVKLAEALA